MRTGFVRIHQAWTLIALCGVALLLAGCPRVPPSTPTRGPIAVASVGVAPLAGGFRINGAGWTPGSAVALSLRTPADAITLGTVPAGADGRFSTTFRWSGVTGWQPGVRYALVARGNNQQAQAPFDLAPPQAATPATSPSPAATPTVQATSVVPLPTPGASQTPTPTSTTTAEPAPAAALAVTPATGWAGTSVRVSGRDFPAGSIVYVSLGIPGEPPAADVYAASVVDTQGQFVANFAFPNEERWLAVPQVAISARTDNRDTTAQTSFNLQGPASAITEWRGEYFDNRELAGTPVLVRNDAKVEFFWGEGSPAANVPADRFSARWTRSVPLEAGDYRIYANTDDGVRLWVDNGLVIDQWNDGGRLRAGDVSGLAGGNHTLKVEYFEATGAAYASVWWERTGPVDEWRAEYFANPNLQGPPFLVRNDQQISFDWGAAAPAPGMPADNFSVRWQRALDLAEGAYRFSARADDGVRVWVDSRLLIDRWSGGDSQATYNGDVSLTGGRHIVRVEYLENSGNAAVQLAWQRIGGIQTYQPVISVYEFDLEQFVVQGRGWPPDAPVEVALGQRRPGGTDIDQFIQTFGTVTAAPDGTFLARFAKPGLPLPSLSIVALTGNYQATAPYYLR